MEFRTKIEDTKRILRKEHPEDTHQRASIEAMLDQAAQWETAMSNGLPLDEIKEVA